MTPAEGDRCAVDGCDGKLEVMTGRDCSCHVSPPCGSCVDTGLRCGTCDATPDEAAADQAKPVIHKRRAGEGAICRGVALQSLDRDAAALIDTTERTSDYWDAVTCPRCLALKPADAPGRTSFKHSHRAEGVSFVD